MNHKYSYKWTLKNANFTKDKGNVFSCFSCGGGSTMGYKLAGFDVIGCNEIDPKMMNCYIENHHPQYPFLSDIREFKTLSELPDELYHLDILDGSPPCSSFSMAGNREDDWGKEKQFREGQSEQVLDTLFFDFIDLAKRLQPKVVIAENDKGLMMGEAWKYMREIYKQFDEAGYYCQHFLLDASKMGVPQRRERVFFICLRKDLAYPFLYQADMFTRLPLIKMEFKEPEIKASEIKDNTANEYRRQIVPAGMQYWNDVKPGNSIGSIHPKGSFFNHIKINPNIPLPVLTSECYRMLGWENSFCLSETEMLLGSSFPLDYYYKNQNKLNGNIDLGFLCGMSVPPVMTAQVANQVYEQWLSEIT